MTSSSPSSLELLAQHESVQQAVATLVVLAAANWALRKFFTWRNRVAELDQWIKAALKERESKVHPVLGLRKTTEAEEEAALLDVYMHAVQSSFDFQSSEIVSRETSGLEMSHT